ETYWKWTAVAQMGGQERICLKDPNTPARKWGPESSRASEEEVANKKSRCMDESDGNRKTKALSDKQLLQVAESLGQEWEQAAIYLKLSITDLDNIKAERQTSVHAEAEDVGAVEETKATRRGHSTAPAEQSGGSEGPAKVPMPVIKGLLDDLWQKKVLSTEDKDSVTENQTSKVDRARCLIDMVMGKGDRASQMMVDSLKDRDGELWFSLGLIPYPGMGLT
ncbi:hypothetical protein NHX12_008823, partial [Muraenolepis orangiensis]